MTPSGCPICQLQSAAVRPLGRHDGFDVDCWRCGSFEITRKAQINFRDDRYDAERWKVSAWVRQYQPEMLTAEILEQARDCAAPSLMVRAKRLLAAYGRTHRPGPPAGFTEEEQASYLAVSWCRDFGEFDFLLMSVLVEELKWLSAGSHGEEIFGLVSLTPKGVLELESAMPTNSAIALCAMWFDPSVQPLYDEVVYESTRSCGYEPVRLDRKEHNNSIDDEIIASIRGARFVIADLTGHRGGVYYEAGFAHGLGLPVIFMLRDDDQQDVHFDVRQQNFILWRRDDLPEARRRLENRIRATLGQGPLKPDRA